MPDVLQAARAVLDGATALDLIVGGALLLSLLGWALFYLARRSSEQALRDQIAFTRTLIDENPNAMYVKDTAGRYVTVNDAWVRMLGVPREQAIGRTMSEIFLEE